MFFSLHSTGLSQIVKTLDFTRFFDFLLLNFVRRHPKKLVISRVLKKSRIITSFFNKTPLHTQKIMIYLSKVMVFVSKKIMINMSIFRSDFNGR